MINAPTSKLLQKPAIHGGCNKVQIRFYLMNFLRNWMHVFILQCQNQGMKTTAQMENIEQLKNTAEDEDDQTVRDPLVDPMDMEVLQL